MHNAIQPFEGRVAVKSDGSIALNTLVLEQGLVVYQGEFYFGKLNSCYFEIVLDYLIQNKNYLALPIDLAIK